MSNYLKEAQLKQTQQRKEILDVFRRNESPLCANDVYEKLSSTGINLSTVYRTLSSLCDRGILNKVPGANRTTYYALCQRENCHHHHLVCYVCNKITELEHCPLDPVYEELEAETGFKITGHSLELVGICSACSRTH